MKVTILLPEDADIISVTASGFAYFRVGAAGVRDGAVLDLTKAEPGRDKSQEGRKERKPKVKHKLIDADELIQDLEKKCHRRMKHLNCKVDDCALCDINAMIEIIERNRRGGQWSE